jgi:hypothetical protein
MMRRLGIGRSHGRDTAIPSRAGSDGGVPILAEEICVAGHVVHVPNLFKGKTFTELSDSVAHAVQVGFDIILERGQRAAELLPNEIVYAGLSLGVAPAQMLAQTRPGPKGALLFHSCVPVSEFGGGPGPGFLCRYT